MRVTVVGGGLAGLACASELVARGAEVVLLDAADRLGGQVRTTKDRGFVVEDGAAVLDASLDLGARWARDLGLEDELVERRRLPRLTLENGTLDFARSDDRAQPLTWPHSLGDGEAAALSFRDGMDSLTAAATGHLAAAADLRSGSSAVALEIDDEAWTVFPKIGPAIRSDAVVLAIPPRPAAWLLHPVHSGAARPLTRISTRAVVVVSLGYAREAIAHPLDAAGFCVPRTPAHPGLQACAFASSQFAGRAPEGAVLLRAAVRPGRGSLPSTTEAEWAREVIAVLQPVLGITGEPVASWVARWPEAAPGYDDGHAAAVTEARAALDALGSIELAGAAYDGWGTDHAIRSGRAAAARLVERDDTP